LCKQQPEQYIDALLEKCKKHHIERTYDLRGWENTQEFLELLARKGGRLLKAGEPDTNGVARMIVHDFLVRFNRPTLRAHSSNVMIREERSPGSRRARGIPTPKACRRLRAATES
jgi:hypothetical protein